MVNARIVFFSQEEEFVTLNHSSPLYLFDQRQHSMSFSEHGQSGRGICLWFVPKDIPTSATSQSTFEES